MKECPKCNTQYDDSMSFCVKDGCQLVSTNTTSTNNSINPPQSKKKGGCLKKIVVTIVIAIIALVAFYKYMMNAATYLRVEPNQIGAIKAGGECKVDIDYDGYVWLINHKPEWVDIDENDNDFTVTISPNRTGQAREGSITIQSGKQLAQVVIQQRGVATSVRVSESSLKFSSSGGTKTVSIETDGCGWKAKFPDWMTVRGNDEYVDIECLQNEGTYRTGTVVFSEDHVSATIFVTQGGLCSHCSGKGKTPCSFCYGMGHIGYLMNYMPCTICGETGAVPCAFCGGLGTIE